MDWSVELPKFKDYFISKEFGDEKIHDKTLNMMKNDIFGEYRNIDLIDGLNSKKNNLIWGLPK